MYWKNNTGTLTGEWLKLTYWKLPKKLRPSKLDLHAVSSTNEHVDIVLIYL